MITTDRIWVTGAYGRLGTELNKLLDCRDFELLDTDVDDVDITDASEVVAFADRNHPSTIINCAGMTDVDACEADPEKAFRVNALGARNLAIAARKTGARMIQISTDDVFDGKGNQPYNEFSPASPITAYGKSKLAGEMFVREFAPKHMIIRSGWVYGHGDNFAARMMRQADSGQPIPVPDDQFGCPTSSRELAGLVISLMNTYEYGLYHGVCQGSCSRYEFAQELFRLLGKDVRLVPTPAAEIPGAAQRPAYSVLDNFMLRVSGIHKMACWKSALAEYVRDIGKK